MKLKLHWQIAIAMGLGVVIGIIFQMIHQGETPDSWIYQLITSMGTIWIRLLKMVIVPLIFSSIVSGVSSVGEGKSIGRLGLKTFTYYVVSSLLAIMIGMILTNLLQPGVGAEIVNNNNFNPANIKPPASAGEILLNMVPLNPIKAAASGHMLGIIFFSIFLGIAITKIQPENQKTLKDIFKSFFEVMMKITEYVIKLAPLGVLGLIEKLTN